MAEHCRHVGQIQTVQAGTPDGCAECMVSHDKWVSLRICLICGHIGCCDDSKNKHATKHFKETHHSVMRGYKTKHRFRWCYADKIAV